MGVGVLTAVASLMERYWPFTMSSSYFFSARALFAVARLMAAASSESPDLDGNINNPLLSQEAIF